MKWTRSEMARVGKVVREVRKLYADRDPELFKMIEQLRQLMQDNPSPDR